MKKTFSLILAVLCVVTLSFSSVVFASESNAGTYEIKTSAQHGTITATDSKVKAGSDKKVVYSPDKGYQLKTLTVDSKSQDISKHPASYTFEKVSANHSIAAVFELAPALKWERSVSRDDKDSTIAKYTVKLSQTVDGAEARDVVVEEKLPSDVTLNQSSLKGDGVTVAEKGDHQYKVTVGSLKNSVTYTYTATVPKDKDLKDLKGTMTMSASNFAKSATGTDKPQSDDSTQTPGTNDSDNNDNDGNNGGQTPATDTFTVTFVDGQGNTLKTEKVEKGKDATAPANPTREGYTFDGWDKTFTNVTADMTVTAKWKTNGQTSETFTVTFVDGQGNTLKTETVEKGKSATAPTNPTREGYTFDGWDKEFTNVTSDMTVTAKWKENTTPVAETFTVMFIDGQGNILKTETVEKGKSATAPADPKRDGYTFDGWDTNFTNVTSNLTVSAKWKANENENPNPTLKKSVSKSEVALGDKVTFTLVASSDVALNNAVIKDSLPKGLSLVKDSVKSSSGDVTISDNGFTVKFDSLKEAVTVKYDAKVTGEGSHKNVASLTASNYEKGPIESTATVKCNTSSSKPELKKTADKSEVGLSAVVKYTVTASVKNDKVSSVTIKDTIPEGMALIKDSVKASDKGSVTINNNNFSVAYKNIEKKTVTITYEAKAVKEGSHKNIVAMTYTGSDSKNGSVTANCTVKVSGKSGDGTTNDGKEGTEGRPNYKTGDFLPYILGGVLIALLAAAYGVYRRRKTADAEE